MVAKSCNFRHPVPGCPTHSVECNIKKKKRWRVGCRVQSAGLSVENGLCGVLGGGCRVRGWGARSVVQGAGCPVSKQGAG